MKEFTIEACANKRYLHCKRGSSVHDLQSSCRTRTLISLYVWETGSLSLPNLIAPTF